MSELAAASRDVDATINYIDRAVPPVVTHPFKDGNQSRLPLEPHVVRIADARARGDTDLERTGFVLVKRPTSVSDFTDTEKLADTYYTEIEQLVCEITGAEKVVVFHGLRRTSGGEAMPPVRVAHIDYTPQSYRLWAEATLGTEAPVYMKRRQISVNVWRALRPVDAVPLAVCDARSIAPEDLKETTIVGPAAYESLYRRQGYHLMHNPAQRWFYFPDMQQDEVLVMKQFDTDGARVQAVAHAAFDHPHTKAGAPRRESFEVRTLAFLPD